MSKSFSIIRYLLKYPGFIIFGLFFLGMYALFSGVSITLAIPVFDYVFVTNRATEPVYYHTPEFFSAIRQVYLDTVAASTSRNIMDFGQLLWKNSEVLLKQTDSWLLLKIICILIVLIFTVKNLFLLLYKLMFINLRGRTIQNLRNDCYQRYLSQSYAFFNQNRAGDSIVRMVNDIDIINNSFVEKIFMITRELILLIIYACLAMYLNMFLFSISLLILPIFVITVGSIGKKIKKYSRRIQMQLSDMFSNIEEVLNSMRIVKAFCKEEKEHEKLVNINKKYFNFWRRALVYGSFGVPISETSGVIIGVILLSVGGSQILAADSDFSFGNFTAFLFAVFSMMHPLKAITNDYNELKKATVSIGRVKEILDMKSEISEDENPISKTDFHDKIEFRNVNFEYIKGVPVIKKCNLTIKKGQKIAFIGSSGSGKTSLVNLINRMYDVHSGEILIDGIDIKKIKIKELRKLFGVVTQDSVLFTESIENNIKYGSNDIKTIDDVKTACKFAYADEFIESLTDGYATGIMSRGSNFSGGQKQRLCIARAIIDDPPVLIFDEATSALDTDSEQKVQKAIDMAAGNRTVLVIAHRLSTILSADVIHVLDNGEIVASGNHEYLIETSAIYKHLYDIQFKNNIVKDN